MLGITLLTLSAFVGSVLSAPSQLQPRVISGVEWSVTDFTRVCTAYPNACTYTFTIVPGGYSPDVICSIVDNASAYANAAHDSLVSVPCNNEYGNPWVISWGYNGDYDFAVMTVVNEAEQEDAWFGYNCVSSTSSFPDFGPNTVYAFGTFT